MPKQTAFSVGEPSKGTSSKSGTVRQKGGKNFVEFMTRDFFYIPPDLEC